MSPEAFIESPGCVMVEQLVADHLSVPSITSFADICLLLGGNPEVSVLPVVDDGILLGVIDVAALALGMARVVAGAAPIANQLMHQTFETVRVGTALKEVLDFQSGNLGRQQTDTLMLEDASGQYCGRVRLSAAYRYMRSLSRHHRVRYCHPLTELPGQVMIDNRIDQLLNTGQLFVLTYWGINNFKAFNDHYGYDQGDQVIRDLAAMLQQHGVDDLDLVGHVSGDKFIVIFRNTDWFDHCEAIQAGFSHLAESYYNDNDLSKNGIEVSDKHGQRDFHPLFTLSVGAVQVEPGQYRNHRDVMSVASNAKWRAKAIMGGGFYLEEEQPATTGLFSRASPVARIRH